MERIYTDDHAAREHLERLLWPDGPVCPHCGVVDEATLMKGKSTPVEAATSRAEKMDVEFAG